MPSPANAPLECPPVQVKDRKGEAYGVDKVTSVPAQYDVTLGSSLKLDVYAQLQRPL